MTEDEKTIAQLDHYSDTYVRIGGHWQYAFGQASLPLAKDA